MGYNVGAEIVPNTIVGNPYCRYSRMSPKTLSHDD